MAVLRIGDLTVHSGMSIMRSIYIFLVFAFFVLAFLPLAATAETLEPITVESITISSDVTGVSTGRGEFAVSFGTADGVLHTRSAIDGSFMAFGEAFGCSPCRKGTTFPGSNAPEGTIPPWYFITSGSTAQPIETALFSEARIFYPAFRVPMQSPFARTTHISFPVWMKGPIKIRNEQTNVTLVDSEAALSGRAFLYFRRGASPATYSWRSYSVTLQRD